MNRYKSNGSLTHTKYGHKSRPKKLHVSCPSCGALAEGSKPSESSGAGIMVSDLSPSFNVNDWEVVCFSCPLRLKGLSYEDLPRLFFTSDILDVWAWNLDHAKCVIKYLSNEDTAKNPYNWFMAYVSGNWKKKSKKTVLELEQMLKKTK